MENLLLFILDWFLECFDVNKVKKIKQNKTKRLKRKGCDNTFCPPSRPFLRV